MRRKLWICLALVLIIPGLLLTTSCAKKQNVESEQVLEEVQSEAIDDSDSYTIDDSYSQDGDTGDVVDGSLDNERTDSMTREQIMEQDIYFDYDRAILNPEARETLRDVAVWLQENPSYSISIEGHCDERGTNEYNMALGAKRADSAGTFLRAIGVQNARLSTISYGEERPSLEGSNEEAWSYNRRVHFEIR